MKKFTILILLFLACTATVFATGWYSPSWVYRKIITIDHTKVPNTDQTNFPVLINLTSDTDLHNHALSSGNDILFTSSDGTTKIPYEREKYTSGTGALVAWVKVSTLSHTADNVLYMYYGNSGASDQQDAINVWDANYTGVWHFKEGSGTTAADVTGHVGMTLNNITWATGEIGGGLQFNGLSSSWGDLGNNYNFGTSAFTVSVWVKGGGQNQGILIKDDWSGNGNGFFLFDTGETPSNYSYWTTVNNNFRNVDAAAWHLLTVVRSGTGSNGASIYTDGSLVSTFTDARNLSNAIHLWVGNANTPGYGLNGTLDEIRISSTFARSADWIKTEYNNQSSPSTFYSIGSEVLPVELNSFSANTVGSEVELNWSTATEVNNYGFEIERLADSRKLNANSWTKIGFVQGHGNSNSPKEYSYVDNNSQSGKIQYRLKQIDFDGQFKYSWVVEVEVIAPSSFVLHQNYPNPFNPVTKINYEVPANSFVQLKVYNTLGMEVATLVNEEKIAGTYEVEFNALNYSSGVYFYRLKSTGKDLTRKMIFLK